MKKRLLATFTISMLCAMIATLCIFLINASANTVAWGETGLQKVYPYGTQLNIPSRQINVGDASVDAVSVLTTPDGEATLNKQVTLDMTGIYTVTYTAYSHGRTYRIDEQFEVYDDIARIGENSKYEYGAYSDTNVKGMKISLASGEEIAFSSIVDLRTATKNEPIIEMFVTPRNNGVLDFGQINFTFTDVENPNCYIRVRGRQSADGIQSPNTYFLAGGNNQPMAGWEGGKWNTLHVNNEWGTPSKHSFYGYYPGEDTTPEQVRISIRYDAETRCVYTGDTMIIDLDSSLYFSNLWEGFDSGRVRVTVSADNYSASMADFVVTYLKGVDLSSDRLVDSVAPDISVESDYEVAPVAKVGLKYPIPEATAKDDYSGKRSVEREIWYNFNSSNTVTVTEQDGGFIPDREGVYAIVYSATDRAGNKAQEIVWVEAKKDIEPVTLTLGDKITQAVAGEFVALAEYSVQGGSGNADVTCTVYLNDNVVDSSDGFRPKQSGTYIVKYVAVDYLGQTAEQQYTVTVNNSEKPVFTEEPVLPRYYISGSEYTVPELYAYDYTGGTERIIKATVSVIDANGSAPRIVENTFTPIVINNGDEITLIFSAGTADPVERRVKVIKSFEADGGRMRLQMQNYFVTENASVKANDDNINITANGAGASFDFANALLSEGMSLHFSAIPSHSEFDGLKIILTDSLNKNQSISVSIMKRARASYAVLGDMNIELGSGFHSASSSNSFEITYIKNSISFGAASVDVRKYDDGQPFNGFDSGFVYLTVEFINSQNKASINISDINDQPVSNATLDRIKPKITLFGKYGDAATLNSVQTLPRAIAGDVLDPNVTLTLTVTDKSGKAVTSTDGTLIQNVPTDKEYDFTATQYGQYSVTYTACDTFNGKDYMFGYVINVEDREKPVVQFNTEIAKEIKLGETIVIPDFTATDNVTASDKLTVFKCVCTPTGRLEIIPSESNSFKPTATGEYEIRITVTDGAGNMALVQLYVTVTQ